MKDQITTANPCGQAGRKRGLLRGVFLGGVSSLAVGALMSPGLAQDAPDEGTEVVVVTGIRGSLEQSMDVKRNSQGVVDAISMEDIGKFPDTNLAESLQRITGVSVNRVNGEGSEVTVRGFGPGFNLVTLNGRTMPAANVPTIGGDQDADAVTASSRAFDFSNLASEGVAGLRVYKTGRAAIPSGGIGATIDVLTLRPLDNPGLNFTVGGKANYDSGVVNGEEVTPEVSGLASWTDDAEVFGVSLFGSYQERDSSTLGATSNFWNIDRGSAFLNPSNGRVRGSGGFLPETEITNSPDDDQLVSFASDSRLHLADTHRERINGQLALQFRPVDSITLTGDFTYAQNEIEEQRTDHANWFNRPFDQVVFDGNPVVSTAVFMHETIFNAGANPGDPPVPGTKDLGFEQQFRTLRDTLESTGFNAEWDVSDALTLTFDAHHSFAKSAPNSPLNTSSVRVSMAAPVIAQHSVDWSSGFPVQRFYQDIDEDGVIEIGEVNDSRSNNPDGFLDVSDLGSQVARTTQAMQSQTLDEARFDGSWDFDTSRLDFGVDARSSKMTQIRVETFQTLGDWGVGDPGDIEDFAPGMVETYCLGCLFEDYTPGDAQVAFRANALDLYQALSQAYVGTNPVGLSTNQYNEIDEDILAAYAQFSVETELLNIPAEIVAGLRYESTEVEGVSVVAPPTAIVWQADNDFNPTVDLAGDKLTIVETGGYTNVLPAFDVRLDFTDDVVGRVSWSKTLARADFANLFPGEFIGNNSPQRPTALGGVPAAADGNPDLLPLVSDNFDVSLEWYYDDASYVSVGFYDKRVSNFVGTAQITRELFDLRDPSSGLPGTLSGMAREALIDIGVDPTDVNLFTMTVLVANNGGTPDDVPAAIAEFTDPSHFSGGVLAQDYVNQILQDFDVIANGTDPLFQWQVNTPINTREARIYGIEIAGQHFFGDSGFGVAGSYTSVDGDVGVDVGADPGVDQFALLGLSDTYNVTLIYENFGLSTRLAYNWRDEFLSATNRGQGARNPVFFEEFGSLDLNVSYDVSDNIAVTFEGINMTEEGVRSFGRDRTNLFMAQELDARYLFGARYKF